MGKHKIIAFVMAPFLAIAGYIAAGYYAADKEQPMRVLVAENKCNISAGDCVLDTLGLKIKLKSSSELQAGLPVLITLNSSKEIDDVLISIAEKKQQSLPQRMKKKESGAWQTQININEKNNINKLMLRLVIVWNGDAYFADETIE